MGKLYYAHELNNLMKYHIADAVREEITAFADDTSEAGNMALRNRIAGMYDLADFIEKDLDKEEED